MGAVAPHRPGGVGIDSARFRLAAQAELMEHSRRWVRNLLAAPPAPALVAAAGERAEMRFLEFFAADIRDPHRRRAYYGRPTNSLQAALFEFLPAAAGTWIVSPDASEGILVGLAED